MAYCKSYLIKKKFQTIFEKFLNVYFKPTSFEINISLFAIHFQQSQPSKADFKRNQNKRELFPAFRL